MIFIPKMSHKSSLVKKEFATDDRVSEDAFPLPVSDDCCPIASTSADGRFLASSQWLFRQPRTLPSAHQNRSFAAAKAGKGAGRTAAERIHYYSITMTKQVFHTNAKIVLNQYISRRFLSVLHQTVSKEGYFTKRCLCYVNQFGLFVIFGLIQVSPRLARTQLRRPKSFFPMP